MNWRVLEGERQACAKRDNRMSSSTAVDSLMQVSVHLYAGTELNRELSTACPVLVQ
jgi:hypothetical protein